MTRVAVKGWAAAGVHGLRDGPGDRAVGVAESRGPPGSVSTPARKVSTNEAATSAAERGPSGSNHVHIQCTVPKSCSVRSRSSPGRNSPAAVPSARTPTTSSRYSCRSACEVSMPGSAAKRTTSRWNAIVAARSTTWYCTPRWTKAASRSAGRTSRSQITRTSARRRRM